MGRLELRYVAHISVITGKLAEEYETDAETLRELVSELDGHYRGFRRTFENPDSGRLSLNAMIHYGDKGKPHAAVTNLDAPIQDGGTITFW